MHKWYGDFHALNDFSLDVGDGEFVALLGPSGCGKTTLLRSIAGLETIDGGEIYIGDDVVSQKGFTLPPEKRRLGLIFQSYALWPHMSVSKNIAYSLRVLGWKRPTIDERVAEVLEMVGLPGMQKRYPSELSGGQMQRVAVARSIAPKPVVLLFDEPLSNLDAKLREKMRFDLRELQQQVGTTAVYVTHDQGEAMAISDRIVLMSHGDIVQIGTGRELYEEPVSRFAAEFVGISNFVPAHVDGTVDADGLVDLQVDNLRLRGVARAGTGPDVVLSIRPESIRVRPAPAQADQCAGDLLGVVEDVVYMGSVGDIFVRVGEIRLRAQAVASSLTKTPVGSTVVVEVDPHDVRVLPAEESASVVDQAVDTPDTPETPALTVSA
ncbi:ABC transporter ATP-binding protein [Micromonospora sp. NPDC005161]